MIKAPPPSLDRIREKVEAGERLTLDEGLFLDSPQVPLNEVGELANLVRERKNGNAGYYNINTHLNADQRLRLSLHVLRVPLGSAQPQGLRDERRAGAGPRA